MLYPTSSRYTHQITNSLSLTQPASEEYLSSMHHFVLIHWKTKFWQFYAPLLIIFGPTFIGSDFPSNIFHPGSDSRDIWCLTHSHWIDLLHCFQVHLQLDIWRKASVVSCDYNFPSVITFFLSYYSNSLRMSRACWNQGSLQNLL